MPSFAVLNENNGVENVIVADTLEVAEDVTGKTCIPCDSTSVLGGTWNGTEFIMPVIEPPAE
jgi:hypothetical protein